MYAPKGESLGNVDLSTGNVILSNLHDKYMGVTNSKRESRHVLDFIFVATTQCLLAGYGRSYFLNK